MRETSDGVKDQVDHDVGLGESLGDVTDGGGVAASYPLPATRGTIDVDTE